MYVCRWVGKRLSRRVERKTQENIMLVAMNIFFTLIFVALGQPLFHVKNKQD